MRLCGVAIEVVLLCSLEMAKVADIKTTERKNLLWNKVEWRKKGKRTKTPRLFVDGSSIANLQ